MRFKTLAAVGLAVVFLASAGSVRADDFFEINATGGGNSVNVDGPNIIRLTNDLIKSEHDFDVLSGTDFTADMKWGGVKNAIIFTENSSSTTATLSIPSIHFTKTFDGSDASDLETQIRDFIKKNGDTAYADFLKEMNHESLISPLDGNPGSATAFIADDAYETFGDQSNVVQSNSGSGGGSGALHPFRVSLSGYDGHSGGSWTGYGDFNLSLTAAITRNVGITLATGLQYDQLGQSQTYIANEAIGIPITILPPKASGISWQITPWGFAGFVASYDAAAGTVLSGGGGTSSLAWRFGDICLSMANQVSYSTNVAVTVDDYEFGVPIRQWLLKNGGRISYQPAGQSMFVDIGISYSSFLNDAAVSYFWTPSLGAGIQISSNIRLRFSFEGDYSHHYNRSGGMVGFYVAY